MRGTDAGAPDSKNVWKRAFGMVRMGAVEMEILHTVGRFDVNACLKSIVHEPDIHIKESYVLPRGPGELDGKGADPEHKDLSDGLSYSPSRHTEQANLLNDFLTFARNLRWH